MEYGRISSLQLAQMFFITIISTAILRGPSLIVGQAKNDLWLSPVWGALGGCMTLIIVYRLALRYPQLTFIQYVENIIGKVPGKILGFGYLFFFLQNSGNIVRTYADFTSVFLMYTPHFVISVTLVLVSAMAIAAGLETLARVVQFFFPVIAIPFLIILLSITKDLDPQKIAPVLNNGLMPSLLGSFPPFSWFSEIFLFSFFFPFLKNVRSAFRAGLLTIFLSMFSMIAVCLVTIMLLGNYLPDSLYPLMEVANYVSIANFFENLESAVMAIWVLGAFLKLSVFYYVLAYGTTQLLGLSDLRPVILPMGLLIVLFAYWGIPNASTQFENGKVAIPGLILFFSFVIPIFLLLISWVQGGRGKSDAKGVDTG